MTNNRGIIVGLNKNQEANYFNESMEELANLCTACQIEVVSSLIQRSNHVYSASYIGTGKLEELADLIHETEANFVIFNHELTYTQIRNIEKKVDARVLDRTALILNIFSERARTKESKLQVEVAKLQYELPRLINSELNLGRQSGGVGTKNRGSGEKKLELDRRRIEEKIVALNKELEELQIQRKTQHSRREQSSVPKVALVGYTNAGKSTVMNALLSLSNSKEDKMVMEKDMLFATLDTSTRKIQVDRYGDFLLSDTVGFVGDLPHHLVKAFRSTLQEVKEADLLLHIIDSSNPNWEQQRSVTEKTLEAIGAGDIPAVYVYNKIDKVESQIPFEDGINISAKERLGMDKLLKKVSDELFRDYVTCRLQMPYTMGSETAALMKKANVLSLEHKAEGVLLTLHWDAKSLEEYRTYIITGM